jgi:hypothetical protein
METFHADKTPNPLRACTYKHDSSQHAMLTVSFKAAEKWKLANMQVETAENTNFFVT